MIGSAEVKLKVQTLIEPLAKKIKSIGISPNAITVLGFAFSFISGVLILLDHLAFASIPYFFSGLCDMFDGIVARVNGQESRFGAFLDSFLDRYGDFFPIAAICFLGYDQPALVMASLFTIMGSFSTSYARAKAESLGIECRVGIVERPERFFIVLVLLVSGYVLEFMVLLAILTNITAFQRLLYVKRVIDKK